MIKSIRLVNFLSFRDLTISFEAGMTVLVGLNGSGKTNLLRALQLLRAGMTGQLFTQVIKWGGFETMFCRSKTTGEWPDTIRLEFLLNGEVLRKFGFLFQQDIRYCIQLIRKGTTDYYVSEKATSDTGFIYLDLNNGKGMIYDLSVAKPATGSLSRKGGLVPVQRKAGNVELPEGNLYDDQNPQELMLGKIEDVRRYPAATALARALRSLEVYTEFDTSENSEMRRAMAATGYTALLPNGSNLFQVLNTISLNSAEAFDAIEAALQEVNPFFHRFRPLVYGNGIFEMQIQEDQLRAPTSAANLSDGTLRYLCLLAIALNPAPTACVSLDEPERGLHPDMILQICQHLERRSMQTQFILTTHLPALLNQFPLQAVRVLEKDEHNQTVVRQFNEEQFGEWQEGFAPGLMWNNGYLGGNRY